MGSTPHSLLCAELFTENDKNNMKKSKLYRRLQYEIKLSQISCMTHNRTRQLICQNYYRVKPEMNARNTIENKYDLMIIVPVFNLEQYITQCVESLLRQNTRYTYHIVIVNDGSTDGTEEVLQRYQSNASITVIHRENGGAAAARNTALKEICGRYVMFVDGDDYLPDNAVESLMSVAINKDADLVQGGYSRFCDEGILETVCEVNAVARVPYSAITGFPCMKVIRAEILVDFCFPEQFLYEDTVIATLLAPQCKNNYLIPEVVYNYRYRQDSGCNQKYGLRSLDTFWITTYCLEEAAARGYPMGEHELIAFLRQCRLNNSRISELSEEIKECVFVLSSELLQTYFPKKTKIEDGKLRLLYRTLRRRSYLAFLCLIDWWHYI